VAAGRAPPPEEALREIASAFLGERSLDEPSWHVRGWKGPRDVPPGVPLVAMFEAVKAAAEPQRIRLDRKWMKDDSGSVATVVPADLADATLVQIVRTLFFRRLREHTPAPVQPEPYETTAGDDHVPDEFELFLMEDFVGASTLWGGDLDPERGLEWHEQACRADAFAATLTVELVAVLRLRLEGRSNEEIALELERSSRTIRRYREEIRQAWKLFETAAPEAGTNNREETTMSRPWRHDEELRKITREMTPDEAEDWLAGYPLNWYRRRLSGLACDPGVVPLEATPPAPGASSQPSPADYRRAA
jgi:hypothetical protein